VRLHRAGEGAPYTGLKSEPVEPVVAAADQALFVGDVESLAQKISRAVAEGIRERFLKALEAGRHAEESVEAGRRFVAAYIEFTHFVEGLHLTLAGAPHD
jgi:hypothetical protein